MEGESKMLMDLPKKEKPAEKSNQEKYPEGIVNESGAAEDVKPAKKHEMKKLTTMEDVKCLTYLCVNNPWRWKDNIEDILKHSSESEFFQIYQEICFTYQAGLNRDEKSFQLYFEDIFDERAIDPEIEIKRFGKEGEGLADYFIEKRKETHDENMDDQKKIYALWKEIGLQRGFNVSFYPDDLDEIFN